VISWRALLIGLGAVGSLTVGLALAADDIGSTLGFKSGEPVLLTANSLERDDERGLVTATGDVELSQVEHIVIADTIVYNERTNLVTARGNVTMLEPSGNVVFADSLELKDDLRDGAIEAFRAKLTDGARIAASSAERRNGNRTTMRNVVYSRCELCPVDRERAPLWQVKAKEVVHDEVSHDIAYYDAWLEFFGVPMLYTPYFEHADPTVKRRSGFLFPSYGNSTTLGYSITTPYYLVLEPWRDLTIEPTYTTNEGPVLGLQYREEFANGSLEFAGSVTRPETQDARFGTEIGGDIIRGHIIGYGQFDIDPIWRAGFLLERSSDETYLNRYRVSGLKSRRTLVTSPFAEGIDDRNYYGATGYYFQSLDEFDDEAEVPVVLPLLDVNLIGDAGKLGGFYTFDANGMALFRERGADSRRLSLAGGWHLPYTSDDGHVLQLSASLRGDLYHVDDVPDPDNPSNLKNGVTGRIVPEIALEWRYPLISRYDDFHLTVEPIVQGILSPTGLNSERIPNEDSQDLELTDTNLFSSNRFAGLDRVEEGPRVNYGLKLGVFGTNGERATALFGQTLRMRDEDNLVAGSGLDQTNSDFVGRLNLSPGPYLDLAYRFRLDGDDLTPRRTEIDATGGPSFLRLSLTYHRVEGQPLANDPTEFVTREEIIAAGSLRLSQYWSIQAGGRRDLAEDRTISIDGALTYEDECFLASLRAGRTYNQTRDVEPDTSIMFTLLLKGIS